MAELSNEQRYGQVQDYLSPIVETMRSDPEVGTVGRYYKPTVAAPYKPSLTRAVEHALDEEKCLTLALVVIAKALDGDMKAVDLLWDRLDGRVPQTLQLDTEVHVHHSMPGPAPEKCIEGVYEVVPDAEAQGDDPFE